MTQHSVKRPLYPQFFFGAPWQAQRGGAALITWTTEEGRTAGFRMTVGPRKRSSSSGSGGGGGQGEPPDSEKPAGGDSGVALKKQIGLVSACGIIIGEQVPEGFLVTYGYIKIKHVTLSLTSATA